MRWGDPIFPNQRVSPFEAVFVAYLTLDLSLSNPISIHTLIHNTELICYHTDDLVWPHCGRPTIWMVPYLPPYLYIYTYIYIYMYILFHHTKLISVLPHSWSNLVTLGKANNLDGALSTTTIHTHTHIHMHTYTVFHHTGLTSVLQHRWPSFTTLGKPTFWMVTYLSPSYTPICTHKHTHIYCLCYR